MDTTLVIMAAGIGSRFGTGIKQLAVMNEHMDGTDGEIIMDYSVFDAVEAGFNQIVFVIRHEIENEFIQVIGNRLKKELEKRGVKMAYTYQEMEDLPQGFSIPEGRKKPWGTGHAVLACKDIVDTPFILINADDYYGKETFALLHAFLLENAQDQNRMAMAGFALKNTVSENGAVTRGVCKVDDKGMLTEVVETKGIYMQDGKAYCDSAEVQKYISPDSLVSMNVWAAYPAFFTQLERGFKKFLSDESLPPLSKEFLVPIFIDELLKDKKVTVQMRKTSEKWIGITYKQDTEGAKAAFKDMIARGRYPEKLWE